MTGLFGIILILFGCRSLWKYRKRKISLNKSRIWAESVLADVLAKAMSN